MTVRGRVAVLSTVELRRGEAGRIGLSCSARDAEALALAGLLGQTVEIEIRVVGAQSAPNAVTR